jgi:hypothetical protein
LSVWSVCPGASKITGKNTNVGVHCFTINLGGLHKGTSLISITGALYTFTISSTQHVLRDPSITQYQPQRRITIIIASKGHRNFFESTICIVIGATSVFDEAQSNDHQSIGIN